MSSSYEGVVLATSPGPSLYGSGRVSFKKGPLFVCVSVAVAAPSVAGTAAHHYLRASAVLYISLGFPHCFCQMVLSVVTLVANTQAQFSSRLCPHVVLCIIASPSVLHSLSPLSLLAQASSHLPSCSLSATFLGSSSLTVEPWIILTLLSLKTTFSFPAYLLPP